MLGTLLLLALLPLAAANVTERKDNILIEGYESLGSLLQQNVTFLTKEGDVCYLEKPLHLAANSSVIFAGNDCAQLRLYPHTYIRIAGSASFLNIHVTSAHRFTKEPITITRATYNSLRPHIYTQKPAQYVHIQHSEFSYLGNYDESPGSSWGVSFWDLAGGRIENSSFHHNYFGFYSFQTKNLTLIHNNVYDNLEYGLDFHDYSDNFVVVNNTVHNNGNHGIIFSKYCRDNKILNNHVYNHTGLTFVKGRVQDYGIHGIMLHKNSNNSFVIGNILENNDHGIILYQSHNNTIKNNVILSDVGHGIYFDNSSGNVIQNNVVFDTVGYGLYSYNSDHNEFVNNYFEHGSYFKDARNGNSFRTVSSKTYLAPVESPLPDIPLLKKTFLELKTYTLIGILALVAGGLLFEIIYRGLKKW